MKFWRNFVGQLLAIVPVPGLRVFAGKLPATLGVLLTGSRRMQFYLVRITFLVFCGSYSDVFQKLVAIVQSVLIWKLQYVGTVCLRPYSDPVWYICLHQYIGTVWFTRVRRYCLCSSERRFFFFSWA